MSDLFQRAHSLHPCLGVACIGEAMVELSELDATDGRVALGFAGDTLNTAIYLARQGVDATYCSALGDDAFSSRMLNFMRSEGVKTDLVARLTDRLPGLYAIELDTQGERSFRYWRSEAAARSMFSGDAAVRLEQLADYAVLYLSAITLAILPPDARDGLLATLGSLRVKGHVIVFDSNYRPRLWQTEAEARETIAKAWAVTTLALPSRDDEAMLHPNETPEALFARLSSHGVEEIVLKDGPEGPWLSVDDNGATRSNYPPAAKVVDTTSAGDSFNAGYLASRIAGADQLQAARAAHNLASTVIGHRGAIIPQHAMPT